MTLWTKIVNDQYQMSHFMNSIMNDNVIQKFLLQVGNA